MHLWCEFFVTRPLFDQGPLDSLHRVLQELLPRWTCGLQVAKSELWPATPVPHDGDLHGTLHQVTSPKHGLGMATLTGAYPGVAIYMRHCSGTLPTILNEFTLEVDSLEVVDGLPTSAWASRFFQAIAHSMSLRYASARTNDEFDAKNMVCDQTGTYAVGRELTTSLPGLYWLNYFGPAYVKLMGRERLLSAPAFEVAPMGDGVLVALDASAEAWRSAAYQQREQAVIEHLGKQYFFSRHEPERKTIAPDFHAEANEAKARE